MSKWEYEITISYKGYYYIDAENKDQAIEEAKFRFSDEIGSWEMAKNADYEVTHVGNVVSL